MTDSLYRPLTREEKQRERAAYLAFLKQRDGQPDVPGRKLTNREPFFRAIDEDPIRWEGEVPVEEFRRIVESDNVSGAFELALWLAVMARTNEGESFGGDMAMKKHDDRPADMNDPMTWIELEELYHTRILLDALRTLGIEWQLQEPQGTIRWFLLALVKLPKPLASVPIFMGEIVGVLLFNELREKALELFGNESPRRIGVEFISQNPAIPELFDAHEMARKAVTMRWDYLPDDILARAFAPSRRVESDAALSASAS